MKKIPFRNLTPLTKLSIALLVWGSVSTPSAYGIEGTINPNTATSQQLQQLPFVGKAKAQALINCRRKLSRFSSVQEIQNCPEIGKSTFEAIKPYLNLSSPTSLKEEDTPAAKHPKDSKFRVTPRIVTQPGEIKILPDSMYYDSLQTFIQYAEEQINITLFVFKTTSSPKNKPAQIIKALGEARKRGVKVSVLLERSNYDDSINIENEKTAKLLRQYGIKVRLDSLKSTTHSKLVIIDNRFCFVGSHNFTHSALAYNNELSLLVDSKLLAQELQRYMQAIP